MAPFPPLAPSPTPPSAYQSALSNFRSSGYTIYESFITLLWQPSGQNILLEIPSDLFGRLVIVNAEIAATDSEEFLLHQPAGSSYWWAQPRGDNTTLDILQPLLETSRLGPHSTMAASAAEGATAPIRLESLKAWDFGSNGVAQLSVPRERRGDGTGSGAGAGVGAVPTSFYFANHFLSDFFGVPVGWYLGLPSSSSNPPVTLARVRRDKPPVDAVQFAHAG